MVPSGSEWFPEPVAVLSVTAVPGSPPLGGTGTTVTDGGTRVAFIDCLLGTGTGTGTGRSFELTIPPNLELSSGFAFLELRAR